VARPPTIVLASGNAGKLAELAECLAPLDITLVGQSQLGVQSAEETATTFVENALLKARHAAQVTGLAAIADDSGLVVAALEGAPGVTSARFAGPHANDAANNRKLLGALRGITDRRAYFYCALVLLRNGNDPAPVIATGSWYGAIATAPVGDGGFGYDPLFLPDDCKVSAAQLAAAEKNQRSHRGKAAARLLAELRIALTR
jgi:XTP/dITP diphosphohydrolase